MAATAEASFGVAPADGTPAASTQPGCLFLVVGPSGVGKDTLMDAARASLSLDCAFAQRVVTRPQDAGGEAHEAITEAAFTQAEAGGAFAVTWRAHTHAYGIRHEALAPLAAGRNVIVNASRTTIGEFAALHANTVVLSITASPEVVRARLLARGREDADAVAARLARNQTFSSPVPVLTIANDDAIDRAAARLVAAVEGRATFARTPATLPLSLAGAPLCVLSAADPVVRARGLRHAARVELRAGARRLVLPLALCEGDDLVRPGRIGLPATAALGPPGSPISVAPAPKARSRDALRAKMSGATLSDNEMERIVRDVIEERYTPAEVGGFLVAAAQNLAPAEVTALTRARSALLTPLTWDAPLVADKHSMGGVPGSRITPVVVAILAAFGLLIPKTSSRAITSAAGTADVMECVARVDLSPEELQATAGAAGGAVAWNGRISHTALDEVMNAITRPLGLRSPGLDVSSILSKKLAVGATHVLIDIPVGEGTKSPTRDDGDRLSALFREVGRAVGLKLETRLTDGRQPIGRGVGPAVECLDAMALLDGGVDGDAALQTKALSIAGQMLEWDPALPKGAGQAKAAGLLAGGAAKAAFKRIVDTQGRHDKPAEPGAFRLPLHAPRTGTVQRIDGFVLSGMARAAGAPTDKGAGVLLHAAIGQAVRRGEPLAEVLASSPSALDAIEPGAPLFVIS